MLVVISISAAAALAVAAFSRLRQQSPEASSAVLRAVRELAAIVLVCTRAVEAIADVLARPVRLSSTGPIARGRGYQADYDDEPDYDGEPDYDDPEDQR